MSKSLKGYQCNELKTCKECIPKTVGFIQQTAANSGNLLVSGKSAVQRLEETKANYVKTESILDCKQQLWHSSHLKVAGRPSIGAYLKNATKDPRKDSFPIAIKEPFSIYRRENGEDKCYGPREEVRINSLVVSPQANSSPSRDLGFSPAQTKPQSSTGNTACLLSQGAKELEHSFKKRKFIRENSVVKSTVQCFESGIQSGKRDGDDWKSVTADWKEASGEQLVLPKHSESEGRSSGADSKHSSSLGDITELENHCPRSKTSDYVSRSSSFKCAYSSDRVRSLISSFEAKLNENIELKKSKDISVPVGRSKSDISHRFFKGSETSRNPFYSNNNEELESFFNNMGLDAKAWDIMASRSESPAEFFDSVSSLNSGDHRSSTDSEESENLKEGLTNADLRRHGPMETSIIEKNARVVKWLYSCRTSAKLGAR